VEIIPYRDSIWFIDRENEHWYFEYQTSGTLWWRYNFFEDFFKLFSLESNVYQSIISEWVEEILNHKVETTKRLHLVTRKRVETVLNYKVETTQDFDGTLGSSVETVLNYKVERTIRNLPSSINPVEHVKEVLNYKVETASPKYMFFESRVEDALKGNS
jgi:hypothetical protein